MEAQQIRRVLIVDDEPNIVSAVQRELNSPPFVHYRYQIEGFTDPRKAIERAREQAFDVVISDYRMPEMDGLAFLKALAEIQPDCVRIVLSGQTDMDALIRMINESHVYRFIPKPWHDYYLKGSVVQALDYAATLVENKRLAALIHAYKIPVPPLLDEEVDQILIVDDDPGVLASLSRILTHRSRTDELFKAIRTEVAHASSAELHENLISVQVTPSARHALKMAGSMRYSCIISDYKMPEMNGIELLQQFADLQPDCQRILISGQITESDLIYAVDSAHIFSFVDKPWTDFSLKAQIALALSHRRMLLENRMLADMVKQGSSLT